MSSRRNRKRRSLSSRPAIEEAVADVGDEEEDASVDRARRPGFFSGAMFSSGPSPMPPLGRTVSRGLLTVVVQPVLVVATIAIVALAWFGLLAVGFEGTPSRLVAVLALPPISTYFDLGTGSAIYGVGPGLLVFIGVALVIRTAILAVLVGTILEALEDGRVSMYGVLRGLRAAPTVLAVHVLSFSIIVGANIVFPVLGPGIGFLGFVAALVGGLYFLGFAPAAAAREGRTVLDEIRRSGRAAMLPNTRHLVLCSLYFFLALPVLVGLAPGATSITANPSLLTWTFAFVVNVIHVGFLAALCYRWVAVEDVVPEEPVKRRPAPRQPSARARQPSAKARGRAR